MRIAQELQFATHDGSMLFYRHWPALAAAGNEEKAIVLLHRGHEHSGRLQHVVDELELNDFSLFAWDARGHGHSPGARGDSPSFAALVKDLDCFVRHIGAEHGMAARNIALIGQSVGAVLAAAWAHDYAPQIRCLVLTAPAFQVKLYVPLARPGLALIHRTIGNFFITSYVKAKFLTHDAERIRSYDTDPLVTRAISARVLLGLLDAADRVVADAQAIRLPVQLLISGKDWVVHRPPQEAFFARLGSSVKERHMFEDFLHDTLGERDRQAALAVIRRFLLQRFNERPAADSLLHAHKTGFWRDEELRLRRPLPSWSPRALQFALTRLSMRTLGRLSAGIAIGLANGFDSGSSLDHVYRNEARGRSLLGRLIDRAYLDAVGWRGIRLRRQHLITAIVAAAHRLRSSGQPLAIVDIAAGHGRYLLDAVALLAPERPQAILLRDYDPTNLTQARQLATERQLDELTRCELGDAFDEEALARLSPRPTLALVSGLYELYSDNDLVMCSLRGLARALEHGAYLIYTGQPWHPQLEMIARTLTSHRKHTAWVMRRRSQAELDELVRCAGFDKIEQWIDERGMFTVSLARRI